MLAYRNQNGVCFDFVLDLKSSSAAYFQMQNFFCFSISKQASSNRFV